ncbi:MAG: hypothetical protein V4714_06400 [Bacteroidota bacterium]
MITDIKWQPCVAFIAFLWFLTLPILSQAQYTIAPGTGTCIRYDYLGIYTTPILASNQGLSFTLVNLDCGLFRVNSTGFTKTGAIYQWYVGGIYKGTTTGTNNFFTYTEWGVDKPFQSWCRKSHPVV